MSIYVNNNRGKFHPDSIWNAVGLEFHEEVAQEEEEEE